MEVSGGSLELSIWFTGGFGGIFEKMAGIMGLPMTHVHDTHENEPPKWFVTPKFFNLWPKAGTEAPIHQFGCLAISIFHLVPQKTTAYWSQ